MNTALEELVATEVKRIMRFGGIRKLQDTRQSKITPRVRNIINIPDIREGYGILLT